MVWLTAMSISESCSALLLLMFASFAVYPFCSNIWRMDGMSLLVTNSSSFLPFRFGGATGGVRVWVNRLIALRSPAVPIKYLPLTAILEVSCLSVFTWYGTPLLSTDAIRVSPAMRQYPSPCIPMIVVMVTSL